MRIFNLHERRSFSEGPLRLRILEIQMASIIGRMQEIRQTFPQFNHIKTVLKNRQKTPPHEITTLILEREWAIGSNAIF